MSPGARYLLDTTVLIDVSKRSEPISSHIRELLDGPDEVGVCAVNVAEFFAGLRPEERVEWEGFIDQLEYWDMTQGVSVQAGIYRYDHARQGRALSATDALVAATAVAVGAILLTDNVKHYPMPELTVRRPPG